MGAVGPDAVEAAQPAPVRAARRPYDRPDRGVVPFSIIRSDG